MQNSTWNQNNKKFKSMIVSSTADLTATLDAAAAVDQGVDYTVNPVGRGVNVVRIPATAHGFAVDSIIYISGTTNYDGMHKLVAVATNTFDIVSAYVAETFAGTETASATLAPGEPFELIDVRFHSNASLTQDSFTATLDSEDGSAYDLNLITQLMAGLSDLREVIGAEERWVFAEGDKIAFAFTNNDAATVGLEVIYSIN